LASSGQELPRAAFEAMAVEAYRGRKISTAQLRKVLAFQTMVCNGNVGQVVKQLLTCGGLAIRLSHLADKATNTSGSLRIAPAD
jgi:hypothetical protein